MGRRILIAIATLLGALPLPAQALPAGIGKVAPAVGRPTGHPADLPHHPYRRP